MIFCKLYLCEHLRNFKYYNKSYCVYLRFRDWHSLGKELKYNIFWAEIISSNAPYNCTRVVSPGKIITAYLCYDRRHFNNLTFQNFYSRRTEIITLIFIIWKQLFLWAGVLFCGLRPVSGSAVWRCSHGSEGRECRKNAADGIWISGPQFVCPRSRRRGFMSPRRAYCWLFIPGPSAITRGWPYREGRARTA